MRIIEFIKKFNIDYVDIVISLKEFGLKKINKNSELSSSHINFLKKKFNISSETKSVKIEISKNIIIPEQNMLLSELAKILNCPPSELIIQLLKFDLLVNQNFVLSVDLIKKIAELYGLKTEVVSCDNKKISDKIFEQKICEGTVRRAPTIVIIGHIDHGKTSLLDYIRKASVAKLEHGGITQKLGAYEVNYKNTKLVFLDTPGHEDFNMIRERGVFVADIIVLLVALDDGISEQTVECINLVKNIETELIIAMNKIDKVDKSKIDVIKREFAGRGILSDDWGGEISFVPISAKTGENIDEFLDILKLKSEMIDLSTSLNDCAKGYILETEIKKGIGLCATLLLQKGTASIGDTFVCGNTTGKVNLLIDSFGKKIQSVAPSTPVLISGFSGQVKAGDFFEVINHKELKKYISEQSINVEKKENLFDNSIKNVINIIVKAENQSLQDALIKAITKINVTLKNEKKDKSLKVVSYGIGDITKTDLDLALTTKSIIFGFGVKLAFKQSKYDSIIVKTFNIIYDFVDYIKSITDDKKNAEESYKLNLVGSGYIKAVFNVKSIGVIAGIQVENGTIYKDSYIKTYNKDGAVICEGFIKSLQKDNSAVKSVLSGADCAISVESCNNWALDSKIEFFKKV